mmetsp:Transcript_59181/g.139386  ORF Transcript_59181/g.139386 Transcript_59181/m.139386 type:complete len:257 (+) Transcript_59181:845-1615(+)
MWMPMIGCFHRMRSFWPSMKFPSFGVGLCRKFVVSVHHQKRFVLPSGNTWAALSGISKSLSRFSTPHKSPATRTLEIEGSCMSTPGSARTLSATFEDPAQWLSGCNEPVEPHGEPWSLCERLKRHLSSELTRLFSQSGFPTTTRFVCSPSDSPTRRPSSCAPNPTMPHGSQIRKGCWPHSAGSGCWSWYSMRCILPEKFIGSMFGSSGIFSLRIPTDPSGKGMMVSGACKSVTSNGTSAWIPGMGSPSSPMTCRMK